MTGFEGTQTKDFFENLECVVFFNKVPLIQNKNMNVYFVYQLTIVYIIFYDWYIFLYESHYNVKYCTLLFFMINITHASVKHWCIYASTGPIAQFFLQRYSQNRCRQTLGQWHLNRGWHLKRYSVIAITLRYVFGLS